MAEGKKITLADLFARDSAKRLAEYQAQQEWEKTPEGRAWREAQDALHARLAAADEQYAIANPPPEDDDEDREEDGESDDE